MPDGFLASAETTPPGVRVPEQSPSNEGELSSLEADRLAEVELAKEAANKHHATDTFGEGFDAKGPEAATLDAETESVYLILKDGLDAVLEAFPAKEVFLEQGQQLARQLVDLEKKKGFRKAPQKVFDLIRVWLMTLTASERVSKFWIEQEVKRRGDVIYEKLTPHQDSL